jgi:hypothetical protein
MMAHNHTARAPGKSALRPKNRVWGFSPERRFYQIGSRRQRPELRPKLRPTLTYFTPGMPHWPSRDPIGERGGLNLYGFVGNLAIGRIDMFGLTEIALFHEDLRFSNQELWNGIIKTSHFERDFNMKVTSGGSTEFIGTNGSVTQKDANKCEISGEILMAYVITMSFNPGRDPTFCGTNYWKAVAHEIRHVRSFLKRMEKLVAVAKSWQDKFESPTAAEGAARNQTGLVRYYIANARIFEAAHVTGPGFLGGTNFLTPENGAMYDWNAELFDDRAFGTPEDGAAYDWNTGEKTTW